MKDFEFIEHTADVGVRIYGDSLEDLFRNAACVLFDIILDYKSQPRAEENIILEAESLPELLVTWLNELIFLFFSYNFLPADYDLTIEQKESLAILKSRIKGEHFNSGGQGLRMEIKAATYHDLKVEKTEEGWMAEVIFDV